MTSHDVVGKVRRIVGERRVGHTGTLDPMATGVLPICVGRSAKITQYLDPDRKVYRCVMKLGKRSDTYDAWGSFIDEADEALVNAVDEEKVRGVFSGFKGDMEQMPPFYSAVKVNGRRLYEYARKGKAIDMADVPARKIHIYSLEIEDMELGRGSESTISFSVECSRGTFIRSICDEAGEMLGTHGYMCSLERTRSGIFTAEHAVTLKELSEMTPEQIDSIMYRPDEVLTHLGRIELTAFDAKRLINGLPTGISRCRVVEKPEFLVHELPFDVSDDYKRLYRVYGEFGDDDVIPGRPEGENRPDYIDERGMAFIGIGILNSSGSELIPKKMFV